MACGAWSKRESFRAGCLQKYLNKWISSSFDLFGTDHSSSAHWAYVWGIKGRYDELQNDKAADLDDLNDYSRHLYREEVAGLVERLNTFLQPGEKKFYTPDIHFNRNIGKWAGKKFHCETGEPLDDRSYEQHCEENLPGTKGQRTAARHHSQREEVDQGERGSARSALDDWRAAEVGD
jgi:hypothetical protein